MIPNDSARHLQRWEDTMARNFGKVDRWVYAAEIACGNTHHQFCYRLDDLPCPFRGTRVVESIPPICTVHVFRRFFGDHVKQDDATEGKRNGKTN